MLIFDPIAYAYNWFFNIDGYFIYLMFTLPLYKLVLVLSPRLLLYWGKAIVFSFVTLLPFISSMLTLLSS